MLSTHAHPQILFLMLILWLWFSLSHHCTELTTVLGDFSSMLNKDLTKLCKDYDLPHGGNKAQMVKRLNKFRAKVEGQNSNLTEENQKSKPVWRLKRKRRPTIESDDDESDDAELDEDDAGANAGLDDALGERTGLGDDNQMGTVEAEINGFKTHRWNSQHALELQVEYTGNAPSCPHNHTPTATC